MKVYILKVLYDIRNNYEGLGDIDVELSLTLEEAREKMKNTIQEAKKILNQSNEEENYELEIGEFGFSIDDGLNYISGEICEDELKTNEEKFSLIEVFYNCYYDTNQDTEVFAKEFYQVVGAILSGSIPTKLNHLAEFEEYAIEAVPRLKEIYKKK